MNRLDRNKLNTFHQLVQEPSESMGDFARGFRLGLNFGATLVYDFGYTRPDNEEIQNICVYLAEMIAKGGEV
jgi:hypothetical protein